MFPWIFIELEENSFRDSATLINLKYSWLKQFIQMLANQDFVEPLPE